ncbi:MAG: hypothetical protein JW861_02935 [Bacteroidales bacterium]|nr:hypothetical protein [Bacteroidales bacterium]
MKYSNIFWGLALIAAGALIALKNLDVIHFSWLALLRLWPLLLVLWGISILPVKSPVKLILSALAILLGILILFKHPYSGFHWIEGKRFSWDRERTERTYEHQDFSEPWDSTSLKAKLQLEAAAGEFRIAGETGELFDFSSEGNTGKYDLEVRRDDGMTIIDINQEKFFNVGKSSNEVHLSLNPIPEWELNLDAGAAKVVLDLEPFLMSRVDIDGGASSIEIKIGERTPLTRVSIDAGATSITIRIPESSACEIETSTVLSSRDLPGFNKIRSGLYQTPNFSDTTRQVLIDIQAAISSLNVIRY